MTIPHYNEGIKSTTTLGDLKMTVSEIQAGILSLDEREMKQVEQAIKMRKEILKSELLVSLRPGDKVRVDNIRPKAICGLVATVNKVNRTTISVTFGEDAGKYSGPCKVPSSCCEKV